MVLKVCGYYWINVSPIKEIIIRCLCTFKLTLKRSLWRIVRLLRLLHLFIFSAFNALATEGNKPSSANWLSPRMKQTWVLGRARRGGQPQSCPCGYGTSFSAVLPLTPKKNMKLLPENRQSSAYVLRLTNHSYSEIVFLRSENISCLCSPIFICLCVHAHIHMDMYLWSHMTHT